MPSWSVTVEQINGKPAEVLTVPASPESLPATDTLVVVIPGNPGVVEYYAEFCQLLHQKLRGTATVKSLGYIAHSVAPLFPWHKWHNLDEQIDHLDSFISTEAERYKRVILVGHSIGSHMSLQVMFRRPHHVAGVVGIQPYLTNNTESSEQIFCRKLVNFPPVVFFVCMLAQLIALLPRSIRSALVAPRLRAMGLEPASVDITVRGMRFSTVLNFAFMGKTELDKLEAPPDWDSMRRFGHRVGLFFGETTDIWAPPQHLEEIRRQAPTVTAISQDPSIIHTFSVTRRGSEIVADHTVRLMEQAALIAPRQEG